MAKDTIIFRFVYDNVHEIFESGNEGMIEALVANIRAFLEAIRTKKSNKKEGH